MKKRMLILSLMVMLVISLAACGSSDSGSQSESTKEEAAETAEEAESPEEEAAEQTDGAKEESEEAEAEEEAEEPKAEKPDLSGFNQVVVDENNVRFEVTGIDPDGDWGYTIAALVENNTDKTMMFSIDQASINGIMMDPFWAEEVAPGKKSNVSISWFESDFEEAGINPEDVSAIEFELRIHDSEDIFADAAVDDVFTIYPYGEENAVAAERADEEGDLVLFDTDECKMVLTGYNAEDLFGFTVRAYLVNKTDTPLMFSIDSASVNGFMADPFWATTVAGGKNSTSDITWMSSDLEENNIETVEELEFVVHVYPEDSWGDYLVNETFTVEI